MDKPRLPRNVFFPKNKKFKDKKHQTDAESCDQWEWKFPELLEEDDTSEGGTTEDSSD